MATVFLRFEGEEELHPITGEATMRDYRLGDQVQITQGGVQGLFMVVSVTHYIGDLEIMDAGIAVGSRLYSNPTIIDLVRAGTK